MITREDRQRWMLDWFVAHPSFDVRRWSAQVDEGCRFDARDLYVEMFWLPILGPSSVLAVRRFADLLTDEPGGARVDLVEFGSSLGIGTGTGRHTQINRTLGRLIDFGIACISEEHLEVHTTLPSVPSGLRRRLPLSLLDALADYEHRLLASNGSDSQSSRGHRCCDPYSDRPAVVMGDHRRVGHPEHA